MKISRRPRAFLLAALGALAMLALPAAAAARGKDRNHDRIPDRWEKRHHLSLKVKQTWRDQDRDHLTNRQEFLAGTNPRDRDSDNDGIPDGRENAGRVESFDPETGILVINLFGDETVSGLVTERTEIECHGEPTATASHSGEDSSGAGEDRSTEGEGDDSQGSQHSDSPDEPGDDGAGPESTSHRSAGDDGENGRCTAEDLVAGAIVKEAELKLEGETATFEKVELAG